MFSQHPRKLCPDLLLYHVKYQNTEEVLGILQR